MELNKENIRKIRGLIIFTILLLMGLWKYELVIQFLGLGLNIVFPFLLGGAIAFILNVPMNFFETRLFPKKKCSSHKVIYKFRRPVSLILTILAVVGILALVMGFIIPQLGSTLMGLGSSIQEFIPKIQKCIEDLFHNNKEIVAWANNLDVNWENMLRSAVDFFRNGAGNVLDTTFSAAKSIISGMTTFFIAFVFACYILLQKERLRKQAVKVMYALLSKKQTEYCLSVCSLTYQTFSNFLTGQCLEAVILGMMFVISMPIFKMPYALLVGVLIAFTALIPIFGAFIGCAVGTFLIFMVDPVKAFWFIVLFLVLQQIEGNLIYPHVVGGSVGLPSIWVLAAVSIGASLMGILGMLIFIPIVSVLYTLFRGYVYKKLDEKNIHI